MKIKNPWFGPKKWGWGWRPITWQGWVVVLVYVVAAVLLRLGLKNLGLTQYLLILAAATIVLILIAYLTGGKPGSTLLK